MYSEILSFKDLLLSLAQDCINGGQDVGLVLDGIEDYCVSMVFKHGLEQKISKQYTDWFDLEDTFSHSDYSSSMQSSQVKISKVVAAREYIDEIVDNYFFGFTDYPYISKMLETIHNTFEYNKSAQSYLLDDSMRDFVFDFLPRFKSYIESPLENKDFETDVYELIKEDPSSIIKSIYFMDTEFIVEKEILKKLESAQEKEIKLPTFYVEISKHIKSEMRKSASEGRSHELTDVLSRMKHFGLIDYDGGVGDISNLKMTELGVSVYGTIKTQKVNVSCIIPRVKKQSVRKQPKKQVVDGQAKIDSGVLKTTKKVVPVEKNESVKPRFDSGLAKKMLGAHVSSKRKQEVTGDPVFKGDSPDNDIVDSSKSEPVVVETVADEILSVENTIDETAADETVWSNVYEGRKFPYGISVDDDSLCIALDVDKKNVFDLLGDDGHVSNEFLCLLSTLMYEGQKDEIAKILGSNGDLDGMLVSLEEKDLALNNLELSSLSYPEAIDNIIDTMNLGISALMVYNLKLDERETRIFEHLLKSPASKELRVL